MNVYLCVLKLIDKYFNTFYKFIEVEEFGLVLIKVMDSTGDELNLNFLCNLSFVISRGVYLCNEM